MEVFGSEGYTIEPCEKESYGTDVILKIKENTEEENFDDYLEEYKIRSIIKKYSDFIRYPIKMDITKRRLKEGSDKEYEEYKEEEIVNSMVPIWKKNKNELKQEDYENFMRKNTTVLTSRSNTFHVSVDGAVSYNAIYSYRKNRLLVIIQKSTRKDWNYIQTVS